MLTLPKIVELAPRPYIAVREEVMMPFDDVVGRVIPELDAWLAGRSITPAGPLFFKFNRVRMPDLGMEFGFPTDGPVDGDERVVAGILPGGRYVSLTYWGPYDDLMEVTTMLIGWAKHNQVRWDVEEGPDGDLFAARLEIYHTDPMVERDPAKWQTELLFKLAD